jgi:hypothetical protein
MGSPINDTPSNCEVLQDDWFNHAEAVLPRT